jgi:hypothetical protein
MTGTNCDLFTHKQSRSYLNHLVQQPAAGRREAAVTSNRFSSSSSISSISTQKQNDRQCTYNVTLRHFHETIVTVEKQ